MKVRLARLLASPALGAVVAAASRNRIRNRGVVIGTAHPAFTATVKAQLAFGVYESAEIRFIREYLRGCPRVLELGSSLGVTAAHIIDVAAPGAEVVCVEANPRLLAPLRATVTAAAGRTGARVRVIHGAVHPEPEAGPGHAGPDDSGPAGVVLTLGRSHLGSRTRPAAAGDSGLQLQVPAADLTGVTRGWRGYALVCDIEGAEAGLIFSAHPVLTGASRLVIELHDTTCRGAPVTVTALQEALLGLGFAPVAERGRVLVLDGPATGGSGPLAAHEPVPAGQPHGKRDEETRTGCG